MFPVLHEGRRRTRRELLQLGALSLFGLNLADLTRLRAAPGSRQGEQRRRNSCIFVFLFGGPSHIDLWDMKPNAVETVRGEFRPMATNVPGIQVCETLPRFARVMDKMCLLRSMTHRMNVHGPACSEIFTGRPYFGPAVTDQATRQDWPSLSSMVHRYGSPHGGLPPSVVLPWYLQFPGQARRIAGQTGGRMGENYNAFLLQGDLGNADFEIQGMNLEDDVPPSRLQSRRSLLDQLEASLPAPEATDSFNRNFETAYQLLATQATAAMDIRREPVTVRERYGSTAVGQSLLMARRLVEAGVSLVTVNWQDETKIDGVNTCWDTHQDNFPKLTNLLCPIFDRAFPAFIEDLHDRGLLETTLVVALGEFGRTPRMGQFSQSNNTRNTGRDHWAHAFTALLAGGGVRGGQVYGATTADGGFIADKPVTPSDLSATILHHLGIDHTQHYTDEFQNLRYALSEGRPISDLG